MSKSEKEILAQLVSEGHIEQHIAEIIETVASNDSGDSTPLDGGILRPTILLLDKSASIGLPEYGLVNKLIAAQNQFVSSLLGVENSRDIYFGQMLFDHTVSNILNNMLPLCAADSIRERNRNIPLLDGDSYKPGGGTALYDAIIRAISMLIAVHAKVREMGQNVISSVVILTDGKDEHSSSGATQVREVIKWAREKDFLNCISLIGVGKYDYYKIGREIGIDSIIDASSATPQRLRAAIDLVSSQILEAESKSETSESSLPDKPGFVVEQVALPKEAIAVKAQAPAKGGEQHSEQNGIPGNSEWQADMQVQNAAQFIETPAPRNPVQPGTPAALFPEREHRTEATTESDLPGVYPDTQVQPTVDACSTDKDLTVEENKLRQGQVSQPASFPIAGVSESATNVAITNQNPTDALPEYYNSQSQEARLPEQQEVTYEYNN